MKKIRILTAAVLSLCLFATVLSACDKKPDSTDAATTGADETTLVLSTNEEGTAYSMGEDGYKYYIYDTQPAESTEKSDVQQSEGHSVMTITTAAETTGKSEIKTDKVTQKNETTTKSKVSDEIIKNESKGISVLSKTSPVRKGNSASVTIMGQAGKSYSIEFYKDAGTLSAASGLGSKTADSDGLVTWTFEVGYDCESGNRKIIIKEKGSDNFVQTSITVE